MAEKDLAEYVEAIELGAAPECVCNMCSETYTRLAEHDPTPLCHACAQEAVTYLPRLMNLAKMAMIPERDGYDQYDIWHARLVATARDAVRARQPAGGGTK